MGDVGRGGLREEHDERGEEELAEHLDQLPVPRPVLVPRVRVRVRVGVGVKVRVRVRVRVGVRVKDKVKPPEVSDRNI